jgi:hypothetical protein
MVTENVAGFQAGLTLFVLISALSMALPGLWAVSKVQWALKPVVLTVAFVATMPFLVLLDRGNVLALVVPFTFAFLLALVRDRSWVAVACIVIASSVKPQFMLLALALATFRYWRQAAVSILASGAVIMFSFLLMGRDWLLAATNWRDQSLAWSSSRSLAENWPPNLSVSRVLQKLLSLFIAPPDRQLVLLSVVLVFAVCVVTVATGRHLNPLLVGTFFLAVTCLVLPVSFAYYAFFAIPVFAVVFRLGFLPPDSHDNLSRAVYVLMSAGLVLSLTPILVPFGSSFAAEVPGMSIVPSLLPLLSTAVWLMFFFATTLLAIVTRNASPRENSEHSQESSHA